MALVDIDESDTEEDGGCCQIYWLDIDFFIIIESIKLPWLSWIIVVSK
jgi:hypothetical protein